MLNKENQNTEFKESWRDEYIKWICGFANAEGGTLFIGIDDSGSVVGVSNASKLLEEIPNKVRDILGIIVDVNLHHSQGLEYLEIITQAYPSPINYKGQYHYRAGSTKQELKDIPSNYQELLEKLRLTEGNYLRRSAVLLFHKEPERFFTGCYVKIGYFESESTILYQDVIEGNLFNQVEKTMDLLLTKYMKALISYEGISRIERYDYDTDALREIIHNAIIHNDYSRKTPIQIRVYHDKIRISNVGSLPDNWTVETLLKEHRSEPFNPDLASAFFRAGYIESWGRGINTVVELSKAYNGTVPTFEFLGGMTVEFESNYPNKVGNRVGKHLTDNQIEILENIRVDSKVSAKKLSDIVGISTRKIEENIAKLKEMGLLRRVGGTRGYWEVLDDQQ